MKKYTERDIMRFEILSHIYIIVSICIVIYSTYINYVPTVFVFGIIGLYRILLLYGHRKLREAAEELGIPFVDYINKIRNDN
jgi:hypothetical protein